MAICACAVQETLSKIRENREGPRLHTDLKVVCAKRAREVASSVADIGLTSKHISEQCVTILLEARPSSTLPSFRGQSDFCCDRSHAAKIYETW
jgi:hypothetical protein